jgi:hypothetical protein
VLGIGVPKTIDTDVGDSEFKIIDHTPALVQSPATGRRLFRTPKRKTGDRVRRIPCL